MVRRENFEMEIAEESFAFSGPKGELSRLSEGREDDFFGY